MRFDSLTNFQTGDMVRIKRDQNLDRYMTAIQDGYARVRATQPWRLEWFNQDGSPIGDNGSLIPPKRLEHYPYAERLETRHAQSDSESRAWDRLNKYALNDVEAVRSPEKSAESLSRGDALAQGERMREYGSPKVSFDRIARLWSAYLSAPEVDPENLTGEDVGHLMIALKLSRSITDKKPDTLDDLEGYVSCIRMIRDDG